MQNLTRTAEAGGMGQPDLASMMGGGGGLDFSKLAGMEGMGGMGGAGDGQPDFAKMMADMQAQGGMGGAGSAAGQGADSDDEDEEPPALSEVKD